jgi:hypothetical protein
MNNSDSLSPVQGPLTVMSMIVTYLSQCIHQRDQLPTVGISMNLLIVSESTTSDDF